MTKPEINKLAAIIIPAIVLRLIFSALFFHPDIKKFHYQVQFLKNGVINVYEYIAANKNLLPNSDTFNYPAGNYFLLGSWNMVSQIVLGSEFSQWQNDWGQEAYSHPRMFEFMLILKFPYLILDLLILALLIKINKSPITNHRLAILWLFNPISLYAIYMLGQIDVICAALTVSSLFLTTKGRLGWAALLLGLGAAIKTYPLLLLPFVIIRSSNFKQWLNSSVLGLFGFILPLLPVITSSAFRSTMTQSNLTQYIFYAGIPVSVTQSIPIYVVVWVIAFWLSLNRRQNPNLLPEFLTLTLSVTLFSHFHAQWIIWSLPFLILLLVKNNKLWPVMLALMVGYFGTVFLIPDSFVLFGLFSSINPQALIFPSIYEMVKTVSDPDFIQSIFHTVLAASGIWVIINAWKDYEQV